MIFYRSYKDIIYSNINENFIPDIHTFGDGFCFALNVNTAITYSDNCDAFMYILEYCYDESLFEVIDASQFDHSDDLFKGIVYYFRYINNQCQKNLEKLEKIESKLGICFDNLDTNKVLHLIAEMDYLDNDIEISIRELEYDVFDECGYFFIHKNEILWTKELHLIYQDSGVYIKGYQDEQIVIFNKNMLKSNPNKILLKINNEHESLRNRIIEKYKLQETNNQLLLIDHDYVNFIDLELLKQD